MDKIIKSIQPYIEGIIGLHISSPWKGYGSTIFLDLGELDKANRNKGQACISILWDWRVEKGGSVLFGSSQSGSRIEQGLETIEGELIQAIDITGDILEIDIKLSNGYRIRSMVMNKDDPQWNIRTLYGEYIYPKAGSVLLGKGASEGTSQEEMTVFDLAEKTANRWGVPVIDPKAGNCSQCFSFIRLDGNGHMLDYGVCSAKSSEFDGRAVNVNSGCPFFSKT